MILLIDNYDSFTYNLVHLIGALGKPVTVYRNDALDVDAALTTGAEAIILSPGPCTPDKAGICVPLAKAAAQKNIPLLGVCLGHQSIAQAHGARIVPAATLMHGKTSRITHENTHIFRGVAQNFTATRYHSLVVEHKTCPPIITPIAAAQDDQEMMACHVQGTKLFGVQFHPESIASEYGSKIVHNFLTLAGVA